MISIQKSYTFCYGHRVWNQQLSNNQGCKCRQLHGHSGKIDVELSADLLRGMVVDFNEIKTIKNFIDAVIDHHFLVDVEDPLLRSWLRIYNLKLDSFVGGEGCFKIVVDGLEEWDKEFLTGLVIVPFVPTSENLALWMGVMVRKKILELNVALDLKVKLKRVRWWESENSFAEWSE